LRKRQLREHRDKEDKIALAADRIVRVADQVEKAA
jgi:hypothetical protein